MIEDQEERRRLRELWSTYPPKESMDLLRSQIASGSVFDEDHVDDAYLALDCIKHFRLVLRPDLFNGFWCGRFKSVSLSGKNIEYEMETVVWSPEIPLAVFWASLRTIEADKGVIKVASIEETMLENDEVGVQLTDDPRLGKTVKLLDETTRKGYDVFGKLIGIERFASGELWDVDYKGLVCNGSSAFFEIVQEQ